MRVSPLLGSALTALVALVALAPSLVACTAPPDDDARDEPETETGAATSAATACPTKLAIAGVTASGAQDGNPAANAVDGNAGTRWSQKGAGSTITVDLGAAKSVCGVTLTWYQGDLRTSAFVVATSTDNTTFTTRTSATSTRTAGALQTTFTTASARYVRLTVNGNSANDWASVSELSVQSAAPVSTGFAHPGVFLSRTQLDLVKNKVKAGAEPWKTAYDDLAGSKYARGWTATPRATIECGAHNVPDNGCSTEMEDARAAYGTALLWYYTGQSAWADQSIRILNAYATTVTAHTGSNAPLQASWAAELFVRGAELIKHTSTRWAASDVARFTTWIRGSAYLGAVKNGWVWGNGNWDLSMIDATMEIAIFSDDRATFESAIAKWKVRVPAYIYLTSDGALPVRPSPTMYQDADDVLALWMWPANGSGAGATPKVPLPDGLVQESCRDFGHVSMGLTAMFDAAETAWVQGVDLYSFSNFETRLVKAMELHDLYLNGASMPSTFCGGEAAHRADVGFLGKAPYASALTFAVGLNHFANRLGTSMPQTKLATSTIVGNGSRYRNKVGNTGAWEHLTSLSK